MKLKNYLKLLLFIATINAYSQFPGQTTKLNQVGPDEHVYKVGETIQLGNPLNGNFFRSIIAFKYKSVLENINDALELKFDDKPLVIEDEKNNVIFQGTNLTMMPSTGKGFIGKIKYFKSIKGKKRNYIYAIIKIPNTTFRIAIPLREAILNGELKSKNKDFKIDDIEENEELNELSVKSFNPSFNVKFLSCKGNKSDQTVTIEFLIKHKNVHKKVCLNLGPKWAKAYDFDGNEYNVKQSSIGSKETKYIGPMTYICNKIPTNVPVKASITFKKILPDTEILSFTTIKVGFKDFDGGNYSYGDLEFQNIEIDWENK